jgi:hypothetical protein
VKTYTFYYMRLGETPAQARFEPVLMRDDIEAMKAAHEAAGLAVDCDHLLVCFGDREIIRFVAAGAHARRAGQ